MLLLTIDREEVSTLFFIAHLLLVYHAQGVQQDNYNWPDLFTKLVNTKCALQLAFETLGCER